MITRRQSEIRRRIGLPAYLVELSAITGRQVLAEELKTAEETKTACEQAQHLSEGSGVVFTIPFEKLSSPEFIAWIAHLHARNPAPVFIWTPRTRDCGLLEIGDITQLDLGRSIDLIPEGILVITTASAEDKLLFDLGHDSEGHRQVDVEVHGKHWIDAPRVAFAV